MQQQQILCLFQPARRKTLHGKPTLHALRFQRNLVYLPQQTPLAGARWLAAAAQEWPNGRRAFPSTKQEAGKVDETSNIVHHKCQSKRLALMANTEATQTTRKK